MSKKGNLSILSKRIVEGSEKNRVGVCSVYTMRHCLQGPCQGPLHIPSKGNVVLYDQKAKKNQGNDDSACQGSFNSMLG